MTPDMWDGKGPIPLRQIVGPDAPDLTRIPRERWEEVLTAFSHQGRFSAAYNYELGIDRIQDAAALIDTLPPPPDEVVRRRIAAGPSRPSRARTSVASAGKASRQMNIRLAPLDHRRLQAVADIVGMRPTTVARQFVLAGVRQTLVDLGPAYSRLAVLEDDGHGADPPSTEDRRQSLESVPGGERVPAPAGDAGSTDLDGAGAEIEAGIDDHAWRALMAELGDGYGDDDHGRENEFEDGLEDLMFANEDLGSRS